MTPIYRPWKRPFGRGTAPGRGFANHGWSPSTIFSAKEFVVVRHYHFVGTGLDQKSDNFKVPFLSCNVGAFRSSYLSCLGLCWHLTQPEIGQLQGASWARRCSSICPALVFVGTGLHQKSDNFKVPILSCYVKRRCSSICRALVFVGTWLNQKSDNFKVPILSCNAKRRCSNICPALVFVGTGLHQKSDNFKVPILSLALLAKRRCSMYLSRPWSLLAPDSTRNRTTSRCPFLSC